MDPISRNRDPLLRIVATLFAMIGLSDELTVERLSRPLYLKVLGLLRPAEAAVRRLVVVMARNLVVKPSPPRPLPNGLARSSEAERKVSFRLFDPRKPFNRPRWEGPRPVPQVRVIDVDFDPRIPLFRMAPRPAPKPEPDPSDDIAAAPLCRRLLAIRLALEDLPRQARRYARWRARPIALRRPRLVSAIRPGAPPAYRKAVPHLVHAILQECHWLALRAEEPDTS